MHTQKNNTLADVAAWAKTNDESKGAIYELLKIPARLGMNDDDLGVIPADLRHFETRIAPASYAPVSRSTELDVARDRGNSRVRALLGRFFNQMSPPPAPRRNRDEWNRVIDYIANHEGFVDRGAMFPQGASRGLVMLRARAACSPGAINQNEISRIALNLSAEKRKTLRKAIKRLNGLIADRATHPEIGDLLPSTPLANPAPIDRAPSIKLCGTPESFRASVELALTRATQSVSEMAKEARDRIAAGEDRGAVIAAFNKGKSRDIANRSAATATYRNAIAFAMRGAFASGMRMEDLTDLREVMSPPAIEAAIAAHVARAERSATLKSPKKSQTIHNRLTALRTIARHGLRDDFLAQDISLIAGTHADFVNRPGKHGMTDDRRAFGAMLIAAPHAAVNLVNAPSRIAARADRMLAEARAAGSAMAERSALRLHASAVLFAVQMSRPVRTSNLIRTRVSGAAGAANRLVWRDKGRAAEIYFPPGEIKNDTAVTVSLAGDDAALVRRWTDDLRPRFIELSGIDESAYLIPGTAAPRLLKDDVKLPRGCVAPSTLASIWAAGADIIGIRMTPHMARHAVATLVLVVEPGNFAKVAAILGDTEETARKHYGHEDGAHAASEMRAVLLKQHPDLFAAMKRRLA